MLRIKKSDLQALIDTITEASNTLDNIEIGLDEANDAVKRAIRTLENTPGDVGDCTEEVEELEEDDIEVKDE